MLQSQGTYRNWKKSSFPAHGCGPRGTGSVQQRTGRKCRRCLSWRHWKPSPGAHSWSWALALFSPVLSFQVENTALPEGNKQAGPAPWEITVALWQEVPALIAPSRPSPLQSPPVVGPGLTPPGLTPQEHPSLQLTSPSLKPQWSQACRCMCARAYTAGLPASCPTLMGPLSPLSLSRRSRSRSRSPHYRH